MPRFFAIDTSSSTTNVSDYWRIVSLLVKDYYQEGDKIIEWNSTARYITKDKLNEFIMKKRGYGGGTYPIQIIYALEETTRNPFELILVTDGEIYTNDIDSCDKELLKSGIKFASSKIIVISRHPDISVAAPFIRNCPSEIITPISEDIEQAVLNYLQPVSNEDIQTLNNLKQIASIADFEANYESILRALTARLIGTVGDQDLRNEICKMQGRIIRSKATEKSFDSSEIVEALEAGNLDEALRFGERFFETQSVDSTFDSKIQNLLRICDGGLRQAFSASSIQAARAGRADAVTEADTLDLDEVESFAETTFVCPISYEDETDPTILVAKPDLPLLTGIGKKETDMLIDCPLNALTIIDTFSELFASFIDHPVSLKMLRESADVGHEITVSPLTRREIIGAIPLGACKEHVSAANWTLSQLVSGGKKLGNFDLWFAVLWFLIKNGKIPYLEDVLPFVEEQLVWRMKNSISSVSLTGLGSYPQARVPLAVACWFCISSKAIKTKTPQFFDTLRLHSLHASVLVDLINLVKYPLPSGIEVFINRTSVLLQMIKMGNKDFNTFRMYVNALTQKCIRLTREDVGSIYKGSCEDILIPVDGAADAEQIEMVMNMIPLFNALPLNEILGLASLVKRNTAAKDIFLPLSWNPPAPPAPIFEWEHYKGKREKLMDVKICPATMRPYFMVQGHAWEDHFLSIVDAKNINRRFSENKIFALFVGKYEMYPTASQFVYFAWKNLSKSESSHKTCLPDIREFADMVIDRFARVTDGVSPKDFINRFNKSIYIDARMKIEKEAN